MTLTSPAAKESKQGFGLADQLRKVAALSLHAAAGRVVNSIIAMSFTVALHGAEEPTLTHRTHVVNESQGIEHRAIDEGPATKRVELLSQPKSDRLRHGVPLTPLVPEKGNAMTQKQATTERQGAAEQEIGGRKQKIQLHHLLLYMGMTFIFGVLIACGKSSKANRPSGITGTPPPSKGGPMK